MCPSCGETTEGSRRNKRASVWRYVDRAAWSPLVHTLRQGQGLSGVGVARKLDE